MDLLALIRSILPANGSLVAPTIRADLPFGTTTVHVPANASVDYEVQPDGGILVRPTCDLRATVPWRFGTVRVKVSEIEVDPDGRAFATGRAMGCRRRVEIGVVETEINA